MSSRKISPETLKNPSFWRLVWQFPKMLKLVIRLMKDRRVPLTGKIGVVVALVYFISPIDFIPDMLLPFGFADDIAIVLASIRLLIGATPTTVLEEHLAETSGNPVL